ncbi:hypothetical protein [Paraburkholderia sp. CNPSo 3281]|uniref:hypothetical protein n=1 Tax=Paraburkholderia sp. CNPSo 3281 TaxID=2940933 RepID=UPI0020B7303E|nr:hypothetical protein [Paraburkholderia sp. CNPSo 3281]MCP3717965.1 hypothetical protein [Paraburkholderia sp. CNPSo 3281]
MSDTQPPSGDTALDEVVSQDPPLAASARATNNLVYQIFYSPETHAGLDSGFIPLDNTGQRPDWYEYWPIRNFLMRESLDENTRYGFLSPKFAGKTGLDSAQVMQFLSETADDVDVVTFSPFFDHSALFLNVFEQMKFLHPGSDEIIKQALEFLAPGIQMDSVVMSTASAIFCNYLVATPAFWRRWLEKCEILFHLAEDETSDFGRLLSSDVKYDHKAAPAKVFLIERIASLILGTEPQWKVRGFSAMRLPFSYNSPFMGSALDLVAMDALKRAANDTGHPEYLNVYFQMRASLLDRLAVEAAAR